MTLRVKQIIIELLSAESIISMSDLALKVGVSKRTISREIDIISKILAEKRMNLHSKTGVGIWLDGEKTTIDSFLSELRNQKLFDSYNIDDRRNHIIAELLLVKKLRKLYWFSNKFSVSEATIASDFLALEKWFAIFNLKIIKKAGVGVFLDGLEENYRRAIFAFIYQQLPKLSGKSQGNTLHNESIENFENSLITSFISVDSINMIYNCIETLGNEKTDNLTEESRFELAIQISIAINRIKNCENIDFNTTWISVFENDLDYILTLKLIEELGEAFDITFDQNEISYICLHIKAGKNEKTTFETLSKPENIGISTLVSDMIYAFDSKLAIALKQDADFVSGLISHLEPTLIRLTYDMEIINPILEGIKNDYPDVFSKCRNVATVIKNWTSKDVPESEIGFLTVHFGAAVARIQTKFTRKVNVGIICDSGIGVSKIMATKLNSLLGDKINVNTYSLRGVSDEILSLDDFLVSSVNYTSDFIEVIEVNPLFSEKNLMQIRELISKYEVLPEKTKSDIKTVLEMDNIYNMTCKIKGVIDGFTIRKLSDDINFEECVKLVSRDASEETCDKIAESLFKRETLATQIYPEFKFGLLHSQTPAINEGVFCAYVPENEFKDNYFAGVNAVFLMLSPSKDEDVIRILGHISMFLAERQEFLESVKRLDSSSSVKLLDETLKEFFISFLEWGR